MKAQADPDADSGDLEKRYPKVQVRDFDGDPNRLTEMDALVAYLQVLGTMVDVNSAAAQEELARGEGPMSAHSTYDFLRHMADSWGLLVMTPVFSALPPGRSAPARATSATDDAANLIFKDDSDGE